LASEVTLAAGNSKSSFSEIRTLVAGAVDRETEWRARNRCPLWKWDHKFESAFLQRGVRGEPDSLPARRKRAARRIGSVKLIRCWQVLTGGKACHAASGRLFDDLAGEAEAPDAV
jgi:hypothetical protein